MKIAFLNKYQNKVNRGAETFVNELAKRLAKHHEVFINKIPSKCDIIVPVNGRWQALKVRIMTFLTGAKMVISGQSGPGVDDRWNLYCFPDAFIALSDYAHQWAKRINPFIRVVKIPNGVDLRKFRNQKAKSKNTNQKSKIVLSVGAFTREKRHDLTIKAVAKLPEARLLLVGSGGDKKEEIKSLGTSLLGDRFEIKSVSREKMPEVYKKASVFAYPTVPWESFGIAMVEAMASGLPVVATDDSIRREIVGDAGLFVNPEDIEEYSLSLRKALETDWGNKPRKQAEKFDWDKIFLEYEKLFKELIQK